MTEYADAAHEAYRRLKWQEENRPAPEELEKVRKARQAEERAHRISRFRKSVA